MTRRIIEIKDWADKFNTMLYTADMTPLGYIHQHAACEWSAYDADGEFVDHFSTKADAKRALAI